ncbi:cadherin-related family member 5-like isoform X1 [Sinocyclocheilus grahami]|uniref:cadherin-related family member 5-like isoform X1 n=1 Tax=Sinocyclocheilus grahami TaxID=75366 RepID=UPI0007ACFCBC|nr:PREDICTED: cadherin-related family member 5-like isoform X1 [Sinocyclocheilus grahami]
MKDMGRCGNVAFCAMVLFYYSFITGDYLCVSSAADVSSSPHSSTPGSDQTQSSTNITNSTEPTPHTDTTTVMLVNSSAPAENVSFSGNVTDSQNVSDVSPVNNETAVTTVKPTTLPPSTTHEPTSSIHVSTLHPTFTTAGTSGAPESTSARSRRRSTTQMTASSSPVQAKAHPDTPSALNVGDHDNSKASTDPLLAGLVSAFVIVAAIVSVLIFLKFRHTNDGPEFRRLQDLPMERDVQMICWRTRLSPCTATENPDVPNIR